MENKRYKISLNWYGELKVLWTEAASNTQARTFVLQKFAKTVGMEPNAVRAYFSGSRDNIKIEEI